jgi:hypothetical protein
VFVSSRKPAACAKKSAVLIPDGGHDKIRSDERPGVSKGGATFPHQPAAAAQTSRGKEDAQDQEGEAEVVSRIWVDVRGGDGCRFADMLRYVGFRVEEMIPVPDTQHGYRSEQTGREGARRLPERLVLPANSRFFGKNFQSLKEARDRLPSEEAARLFQTWLR